MPAPDAFYLPFAEHADDLGARLAAARRTNTEIAQTLHLSESTVKNHLKRIFDKLGLDGGARGKRVLLASLLPPKDSP